VQDEYVALDALVARHIFKMEEVKSNSDGSPAWKAKHALFDPAYSKRDDGKMTILPNEGISVTVCSGLTDGQLRGRGLTVLAKRLEGNPSQRLEDHGWAKIAVSITYQLKAEDDTPLPPLNVIYTPGAVEEHAEIVGWPDPIDRKEDVLAIRKALARGAEVKLHISLA
jgi:hypothetical protein